MYIIPKDRPEPHDDACVICFLGVTKFGHQGAKKLLFWALAWLTDKINPMYIIPKDRRETHDDACVIFFWVLPNLATYIAHIQDQPHVYYTKRSA